MMVTGGKTPYGWRKTNQSLPYVKLCRKSRKRQRKRAVWREEMGRMAYDMKLIIIKIIIII